MSTLVRAGMTPAERCRYVADLIEKHPEHFDMNWYAGEIVEGSEDDAGDVRRNDVEGRFARGWRPDLTEPGCGTTCCIAGWAIATTAHSEVVAEINAEYGFSVDLVAGRLLAIDGSPEDLFYETHLGVAEAAFLLRWHADELDRA